MSEQIKNGLERSLSNTKDGNKPETEMRRVLVEGCIVATANFVHPIEENPAPFLYFDPEGCNGQLLTGPSDEPLETVS
jgi:hypothetical protein